MGTAARGGATARRSPALIALSLGVLGGLLWVYALAYSRFTARCDEACVGPDEPASWRHVEQAWQWDVQFYLAVFAVCAAVGVVAALVRGRHRQALRRLVLVVAADFGWLLFFPERKESVIPFLALGVLGLAALLVRLRQPAAPGPPTLFDVLRGARPSFAGAQLGARGKPLLLLGLLLGLGAVTVLMILATTPSSS